jgi:hypothetical protein
MTGGQLPRAPVRSRPDIAGNRMSLTMHLLRHRSDVADKPRNERERGHNRSSSHWGPLEIAFDSCLASCEPAAPALIDALYER